MKYAMARPGVAVALATLAAWPAAAQTPSQTTPSTTPSTVAPRSENAVEQIVVTANKRKELQRTVANSVTAISGKELDQRQEFSLQDFAAQVPGLSLEASDKTAVRIVLRGLNTGSAGSTVASLLDDVPTNSSGAVNNAATNTPNFDTYDLQRIEVLRGPQGTLYGATAEGGLIKYVTNPPDPLRYSGGLETGVDGVASGGIGGSVKGFINIPLADGKAAIRLTGWNEYLPGYIDNPQTGKTDTNSGQQYGWRASVLLNPVENLTVRLTVQRQSLFANNANYLQIEGAALDPTAPPPNQLALVNGLRNASYVSQPSQNENATYYANIDYDFDFAHLTSVTGFSYGKYKTLLDYSFQNAAPGLPLGGYLGAAVYGVPIATTVRQNSDTNKFSQELRLASEPGQTLFGQKLDWIGGLFFTRETSDFLQYVDARPLSQLNTVLNTPAPLGGAGFTGTLSEWAVFGQADYHIIPTVDVEVGGRWSGNAQHSDSYFACCVLYGPNSNLGEIYSNDHDALYSIAPRWRPTDSTMLYARIATGYRPGGPNTPVPGTNVPLTYGPDHTTNYEVGIRQDLFDKAVAIDVTGFYINWHDVQILSLVNTPAGPVGVNGNAGSAVSKGVEWSLAWVPFDGLRLSAVGAYTDARLTVDAPGLGGASGDYLPYVPDVSGSLNANYSWTPIPGYTAFASGTATYTGQRFSDFAPAGSIGTSHVLLPNYTTGALRLGISRGNYSAELYVDNISNARALTYYSNEGGFDETGQAAIIEPRLIGLVAKLGF
jgi:iron complex outermembrane receptor protein